MQTKWKYCVLQSRVNATISNCFSSSTGIAHELSLAFGDPGSIFCTVCDNIREKRPAIIHTTYEKQDLAALALMNTK